MKDEEKICEFGQVDVGGQRAGECVSGDVSVISSQGEGRGDCGVLFDFGVRIPVFKGCAKRAVN